MRKLFNKLLPMAYGQYFNLLALFSEKKVAKKAFELFITVRKGRVLPKQYDYLEVAKNEVLEIGEHLVQTYRWPGNKETVLLVHGWESNSFRWRNLIGKLQEADYTIIAFDAPGHGHSSGKQLHLPLYADCIQKVIDVHDPAYLIAHSFGGMAILYNEFLQKNAGVHKMVTIASPSEFHEIFTHYQNLLGFNNRVLQALEDLVLNRFGAGVRDFSSSIFVKNNTKKGLLIHDELDQLAPFHASEKVYAAWQRSQFIRTKGLGHSLHQDAINKQIISFLES
jgi:pimeloyl-ACP methyl ester carboxylesterase